jgi:F-type H+-transporting ATPase subunit alpha
MRMSEDTAISDPAAEVMKSLQGTSSLTGEVLQHLHFRIRMRETGTLVHVEQGIARVTGLPGVHADELIIFPGGLRGIAFDIGVDEVGIVLLDESTGLMSGTEVHRTDRVLEIPVGESLIGRVLDPLCRPLDSLGPVQGTEHRWIERQAPDIMARLPVVEQLRTGIKVIDALIPIGKGQRELIVGDRQTGKTAIAVDTIINQKGRDVICIYCSVGKEISTVARVIADLRSRGAMEYSIVMAASGEDPPGLQYIAPYSATTVAEYFLDNGRDVLIIYDDLTRHARVYREISLLLKRPPGREAFPGDIFYIHSRLLERSAHLKDELGGGSLTALPIVETQAQNISAYIPTNLISITDGQLYLSPELFHRGQLPAVDVGRSVSRVGGKTQLKAYREVAGDLRLSYAQFEELETFSRIGTRLDEQTRKTLERGRKVREILKQPQYDTMTACEQIAVLAAMARGVFQDVPVDEVGAVEEAIRGAVRDLLPDVCEKIESDQSLNDKDWESLIRMARRLAQSREKGDRHAEHADPEEKA